MGSFWARTSLSTSGELPRFSGPGHFLFHHKISTVNRRHSSHLGTKSNHSASTNALVQSFTAQATGFFTLERPTTTTTAIVTQVFMFRYEHVNSTRKFTIVAEIVSLLKKIYKRDGPLRAVFKVKTLAVLFPPYPCEVKTNTAKFKSAAILALACFYGSGATIHTRGLSRARGLRWDRCG